MTTKMKGLFKGLRYISHIFEEEKEQDIQIGFPTDVKHVAHIGWDGPSEVDSSQPSWMKEFKSTAQSGPLGSSGEREEPEIKWVSEDSKRGNKIPSSPRCDLPDLPKSTRRHASSENGTTDSPRKKDKSRQSRRSKDAGDGSVRSSRRQKESGEAAGSGLPDIPKKNRRKKSKDSFSNEGSSRRSSKAGPSTSDPFSDIGPDSGPIAQTPGSQLSSVTAGED